MRRDLVLGALTLAIAGGYLWLTGLIPRSQLADAVGPQGLPRVYAVLLAMLSLILIVQSRRSAGPAAGAGAPDAVADTAAPGWRVGGMLAIGIAYLVAAPWLGYPVSIALLLFATTYYQGGRLTRQVVIVAVAGGLVFWLLFVGLMGVPQPAGWWPRLP